MDHSNDFLIVVTFGVCLFLLIAICNFTRFHLMLVLKNNTTLEQMDAERNKTVPVAEVRLEVRRGPKTKLGKCVWDELLVVVYSSQFQAAI